MAPRYVARRRRPAIREGCGKKPPVSSRGRLRRPKRVLFGYWPVVRVAHSANVRLPRCIPGAFLRRRVLVRGESAAQPAKLTVGVGVRRGEPRLLPADEKTVVNKRKSQPRKQPRIEERMVDLLRGEDAAADSRREEYVLEDERLRAGEEDGPFRETGGNFPRLINSVEFAQVLHLFGRIDARALTAPVPVFTRGHLRSSAGFPGGWPRAEESRIRVHDVRGTIRNDLISFTAAKTTKPERPESEVRSFHLRTRSSPPTTVARAACDVVKVH